MVRRRSNRIRRRRNRLFRRVSKRNIFLDGGNVQSRPIPRARAVAPWNSLNVIRYIATEPAKDAKITFSYLFDIIVSQYGLPSSSITHLFVRLHSIELRDMNARSLSMFVYSTVDDITADACPLSSQKCAPARMANARVKYVYPISARQVPLYLAKDNKDSYLAIYRVGSANDTTLTGKNVTMTITGSWMSGLAGLSSSELPGSEFNPDYLDHSSKVSVHVNAPSFEGLSMEGDV